MALTLLGCQDAPSQAAPPAASGARPAQARVVKVTPATEQMTDQRVSATGTLAADEQAAAFEDLRYYTDQVAPALTSNGVELIATRADTLYIALPDNRRRTILLSGLDYPFGYVLVDPGGPERILTGVYSDDDLLDELRAYFDLSDDSASVVPRATT